MSSAVVDSPVPDAATVVLLPGFDDYVLAYKDRGDVLAPEHASKIVPGEQRGLPVRTRRCWPRCRHLDTTTHDNGSWPDAVPLCTPGCSPGERDRGSTPMSKSSPEPSTFC